MSKAMSKVIEFAFYLLAIIVPLILTPYNYELFEYNKMMVVYGLTIIIAAAWLIKVLCSSQPTFKCSFGDIPILIFLASQILSTLFSMDIHTSIWGYYSRFHGGLLSTIAYVILYFAFVSNLRNLSHLRNLIKIALGTGFLVSIYGVLEHFGIDKNLWVQDVQNRVFSTLGQPNWLGAYIAVLIPISILPILPINQYYQLIGHWVYWIIGSIFYATLLFTKSRSGVLGFWVADFLLLLFLLVKNINIKNLLILNTCYLILSFIIGGAGLGPLEKYTYLNLVSHKSQSSPSPAATGGESVLSVGITESGDIRKIVWRGAWDIFIHNPIFGSGVETFAYAYYKYRPAAHNMTSEWDFLYNKAHNEYLNFLATTGIVGFGSYMGLIISFLIWNYNRYKNYNNYNGYNLALLSAWLSILVTNFFGFSVVIIGLFFFLIPAASYVLANSDEPESKEKFKPKELTTPITIIIIIIVITVITIEFNLIQFWRADTFFAKGYRQNRTMQFSSSYENLSKAIKLNPNEPFYADELAYSSSVVSYLLTKENDATESAQTLYNQAMLLANKVIGENPNNINYHKSRVRTFYVLSQINPKLKDGIITTLKKAENLAPTDPKIGYNLAVVLGQAGQQTDALDYFQKTIKLKPDYRDAYYGLALLYKDMGKSEEAKQTLEFILKKINPNDTDAKKKLNEWK